MEQLFFLMFASLSLLFAVLVVSAKNPVHGALALMACFVQIAALYILLRSPFLAVVQIFVYVGTIMVLYVFVMMMLDLKKATQTPFITTHLTLMLIACICLGLLMAYLLLATQSFQSAAPGPELILEGTSRELGEALFRDYLLPFEVVSIILLLALIGAIYMAGKGDPL